MGEQYPDGDPEVELSKYKSTIKLIRGRFDHTLTSMRVEADGSGGRSLVVEVSPKTDDPLPGVGVLFSWHGEFYTGLAERFGVERSDVEVTRVNDDVFKLQIHGI